MSPQSFLTSRWLTSELHTQACIVIRWRESIGGRYVDSVCCEGIALQFTAWKPSSAIFADFVSNSQWCDIFYRSNTFEHLLLRAKSSVEKHMRVQYSFLISNTSHTTSMIQASSLLVTHLVQLHYSPPNLIVIFSASRNLGSVSAHRMCDRRGLGRQWVATLILVSGHQGCFLARLLSPLNQIPTGDYYHPPWRPSSESRKHRGFSIWTTSSSVIVLRLQLAQRISYKACDVYATSDIISLFPSH